MAALRPGRGFGGPGGCRRCRHRPGHTEPGSGPDRGAPAAATAPAGFGHPAPAPGGAVPTLPLGLGTLRGQLLPLRGGVPAVARGRRLLRRPGRPPPHPRHPRGAGFRAAFGPQPRGYWLGLSDREQEGGWRWLDGTPPAFSSWGRGEPNGGRGQNCAALLPHGRWDDLPCERALPWVCERAPPC
ncbi:uncharacterized protein ACIBXB_022489 [Morphnus guianensis]